MTHTVVVRRLENFGSVMAEVQVVDISALDSAGVETGVGPEHITNVDGFAGHVRDGEGQFIAWDQTNDELHLLDGAGSQVGNNSEINGVHCVWTGRF